MFCKLFVLACILCISLAEPPRWRFNPKFQRQEATTASVPHTVYGPPAPAASYGPPPSSSYGPPPATTPSKNNTSPTTTPASINGTSTELPTTTIAPDSEIIEPPQGAPNGSYYIYHPSGLLQKVTYVSNNNAKRMAFDVKLKYQNVNPIRGPVYTYDPHTFVFQKIVDQV